MQKNATTKNAIANFMIKNVYFEYGDNDSEVFTLFSPKTLEKKADFSSELSEFIDKLKEKDGKSYALVNALSSGEFFGSNRNGDFFPEKALQDYHKTFEAMAHIYKHQCCCRVLTIFTFSEKVETSMQKGTP